MPELAAELVHDNPDVLVKGIGTLAAKAARAATSRIPIVFTGVGDPVAASLVASLNRPGANITGMSGQAAQLSAKRLQLLNDPVPGKKLFAVLGNPDTPFTASALQEIKTAAAAQGQPFAVFEARNANQFPPLSTQWRGQELPVCWSLKIPCCWAPATNSLPLWGQRHGCLQDTTLREFADAGGLICYGADEEAQSYGARQSMWTKF